MQVMHQYDGINSKGYCYKMAEGAFKAFLGFRLEHICNTVPTERRFCSPL